MNFKKISAKVTAAAVLLSMVGFVQVGAWGKQKNDPKAQLSAATVKLEKEKKEISVVSQSCLDSMKGVQANIDKIVADIKKFEDSRKNLQDKFVNLNASLNEWVKNSCPVGNDSCNEFLNSKCEFNTALMTFKDNSKILTSYFDYLNKFVSTTDSLTSKYAEKMNSLASSYYEYAKATMLL